MAKGKRRRRPLEAPPAAAESEVGVESAVEVEAEAKPGRQPPPDRKPQLDPEAELPRALPQPLAAALVFLAAGAVLMLEILAVRLLAPYVGLTLETTTSIIGAALAGIAAGAAVGGYLADRMNTRLLIVGLFVGGGLLSLLTVPIVHGLGPGARDSGDIAALGITALALVPAAAVLSAVSPAVAHLQLHDLTISGTVVGRLSAWATAGALIGTFGTGFVLIPAMSINTAVLLIGVVLVLVGVGLGARTRVITAAVAGGAIVVAAGFGALSQASESPCVRETKYHCLDIERDETTSFGYHLILDGTYNSYVDLKDPTSLKYEYTQWIARAINASNPGKAPLDVVFVGGGGFTLPRWLIATRPGSHAEVLEVDGDVVEIDQERLGLRTSPDLEVAVGDARMTIRDVADNSADVVVGDAFSGFSVPWHLTTSQWMDEVKRVLEPGGIYALNLIDTGPLDFIKAEVATVLGAFPHVRLTTYMDEFGKPEGGNVVVIASERPIDDAIRVKSPYARTYNQGVVEGLAAEGELLHDDYAPVDQLRTED